MTTALSSWNAIAQLKVAAGDLDRVRQIVRVEGYVHCGPGFRGHPRVLNGASDLLNAVFGERGRHTRTALGIGQPRAIDRVGRGRMKSRAPCLRS